MSLAGGVENWGHSIEVPLTDPFRETFPDPLPILPPVAPGPMRGWTWAEQVRRANCPLCIPPQEGRDREGLEIPTREFYNWYALFPPLG